MPGTDALHSALTGTNIHVPYAWSYADQTAREAASGFAAGDVGKLALQEDDDSLWILTATTPTWVAVGSGSTSGMATDGWTAASGTWSYAGAADPTYTATVNADLSGVLSAGMRIRLGQTTGGTKYFIITAVSYSAPNTTVTLYGGTDYDLEDEAISDPYYAVVKAPYGFPLDPLKWTASTTDTTLRSQATPTRNTWYNLGGLSIAIPIGVWDVSYQVNVQLTDASPLDWGGYVTLSTANNSESDAEFTGVSRGNSTLVHAQVYRAKHLSLAAATTYYLNVKCILADLNNIYCRNDITPLLIRAVCAYL